MDIRRLKPLAGIWARGFLLDRLNEATGASHEAEIVLFAGWPGDYGRRGPATATAEVFIELHIIELNTGIR